MSLYNWLIDAAQESRLTDHDEEIQKLKEQVIILKEWVDYLNAELTKLRDQQAK